MRVLLVSVLVVIGLVALSAGLGEGRAAECTHQGYELIDAKFAMETYRLCIRHVDIGKLPLASENAAILLDPDAEDRDNILQALPLDEMTLVYGYPVHAPHSGSAEGYIGEDQQFHGVLHLGNRTLHADPYGYDRPMRTFGAFDTPDERMGMPRARRHHFHAQYEDPFGVHFPYRIEERRRIPGIARARVCELLLLADKSFFESDANASLTHAVQRMVHAVAQADVVFRNTDFNEDGIPDNIGFTVKYILLLTSDETNKRVFGHLLSEKVIDGRQYLMKFARLRRLSEVCLGVAFSGHAFLNRTLGLSFTSLGGGMGGAAGGLCDRRAHGRSFNTLALAHSTQHERDRVPERIAALTLTHEMGHSFGAHHDDNFPNPECRGFLMGSQSTSAEDTRHFEFSICSKRFIAATLNSMSYCLKEEDRSFCGNGIVEEGEACDCGMPTSCHRRDRCCTPRAGGALVYVEGTLHVEGCVVAPAALCHPSQGMCCTQDCKYADLSQNGIDCTSLDLDCNCVDMASCRCALGGRCLPDGGCHAAECALLGLEECRCQKKGAGGKVSEARMCGVCCLVKGSYGEEDSCVGAEFAARWQFENGRLPDDWPDSEYRGPNVSVEMCNEEECRVAWLRAWPAGAACVSRGVVGLCSLTGVCKPRYITPRTNIFPATMNMELPLNTKFKMKSQSAHLRKTSHLYVFTLVFVINRICK